MANITTLPIELQIKILSFITSFYDRTNVAQVCKLWNEIIAEASTKSKLKYNYDAVTGSRYPVPVHKLLQLYAEDYAGTGGGWGTSLRGIFFGCTIENGATKEYFIHDGLSTKEGAKGQINATRLDISSFDILNDLVCKQPSDDARGESIGWDVPQEYKSIIDKYSEYDSDERLKLDSDVIKLMFDISCTFGNKPDEFYTRKLKIKTQKKLYVYETTTVRELVERSRRRVEDSLRLANLRISEPYELRFEVRSYNYGGEDDCFLKLSVNIYHKDEDYIKGNPFKVMRATRDRLSKSEFHMPDYLL
ncbi:uncharacterized protein DFL_001180 [Arthrobotrys flagrans]|uniref:F-box domain-containing protein n=1 Tax=Arthrobotrys flagrans TaxID=97331 RepID=A0A437AGE7_ARTFL|nr:hypothetical protein DFL_001180 [Arthrobotrys flagrans]